MLTLHPCPGTPPFVPRCAAARLTTKKMAADIGGLEDLAGKVVGTYKVGARQLAATCGLPLAAWVRLSWMCPVCICAPASVAPTTDKRAAAAAKDARTELRPLNTSATPEARAPGRACTLLPSRTARCLPAAARAGVHRCTGGPRRGGHPRIPLEHCGG